MELVKQSFDLSAPTQAIEVATLLQTFVKEKKLTATIQGKQYPLVEAWQFAGSQLGLYPICTEIVNQSTEGELKYYAKVEVRRFADDKLVSNGFAICSNREFSKKRFDEYAIASMAQTRATGKAFRNLLAWLMKAAGFEATPAEEMEFNKQENDLAIQQWLDKINGCGSVDELLKVFTEGKSIINSTPELFAAKEAMKKSFSHA